MKILVLGAGGIGSVVGGCLSLKGHDVTLVDPWYEHIAAIADNGLLVKFASGPEYKCAPKACQFKDMQALEYASFDMGFVAVNAYDTDWAVVALDRFVKRSGKVCCFQNGINDDRVAAVAGEQRTLGVIMTISAAVYEPGIALRTDLNPHAFKVGELDGSDTPVARELASMLNDSVGPSSITLDLWGQRWSKLMLNAMNNALAGLTGWMTIKCRTHHDTQRIGIQLAAEAVRVARAHGRNITEVLGLQADDIVAAAEGRNVEAAQKQLGAVAASAGGESRPSFGQDVVKGRRTEIDELNGLVARMGRERGVATPFCDKIVELVRALGVGFTPSTAHIDPLIAMLPGAQPAAAAAAEGSAAEGGGTARKRPRVDGSAPTAATDGEAVRTRTVALVTGAGSGIGRAVALRLAAGGWQAAGTTVTIVLTGRRREPLQETADACSATLGCSAVLVAPADVSKEADVLALFSTIRHECGRLDLLFNNAGVNVRACPLDEVRRPWHTSPGRDLCAVLFRPSVPRRLSAIASLSHTGNRRATPPHLTRSALHRRLAQGGRHQSHRQLSRRPGGVSANEGSIAAGRPHHQQRLHLGRGPASRLGAVHGDQARDHRPHQVDRARRPRLPRRVRADRLWQRRLFDGEGRRRRHSPHAAGAPDLASYSALGRSSLSFTAGLAPSSLHSQADGSTKPEPLMAATDAANAVHYMASLPLGANVLSMTVMATAMPYVGRG